MDMAVTVYQLKVVLRDVQPPVWRRVLVPADATIRTLHETVQVVMGWTNCHLHQFIIHGKGYGVAYEGGIPFADPGVFCLTPRKGMVGGLSRASD